MIHESISETQTLNGPTLGYSLSVNATNGATIQRISSVNDLIELQQNSSDIKLKQPLTYPYYGSKGSPKNSATFQFDLDTTLLTEFVSNNYVELFKNVPNLIFIQESISGKLHFVSFANRNYLVDVEEAQYRIEYSKQYANLLNEIKKLYFKYCFTDYPEDEIIYFRDKPNGYADYVIDFHNLGENAIDLHNADVKQGLFLSKKELWLNNDIEPLNPFDEKTIKELKKDWPDCFLDEKYNNPKIQRANEAIKETEKYDGKIVVTKPHKLKIDKNYTICEYSGNEARWRIGDALFYFTSEDETEFKKIRKELFVNSDEINHRNPYRGADEKIKNWLIEEFGINKEKVDVSKKEETEFDLIIQNENEYLNDNYKKVYKLLFENDFKKVLLQGNTGIGKTEFIKRLLKDLKTQKIKTISVLPYNVMLQHYAGDSDFNIIKKGKDYQFDEDRINVCIWDQLTNKKKMSIEKLNKYGLIVVDESHLAYTNQDFRQSAIKLNEMLSKYEGRVFFVTATPTKEVDDFGIEKVVRILKNYPQKEVYIYETENTYQTINNIIWNKAKQGEKVAVFSDHNSGKLFYNLNFNDSFRRSTCLIHSKTLKDLKPILENDENKDNSVSISQGTEFEAFTCANIKSMTNVHNIACNCIETETLTEDVTFLTSVAFSSINFLNQELINVVVEVGNETDSSFVIQAIGRFRKHNIKIHLVFDKRERNETDIETQNNVKLAMNDTFDERDGFNEIVGYQENVEDVNTAAKQKEVKEYKQSEDEKDVLKKVNSCGNFDFFRAAKCLTNSKVGMGKSTYYSRSVSEYMLTCLNTFDDLKDIDNQVVKDKWRDCIELVKKLKKLKENNPQLSYESIKEFINGRTSANTCLFQTAVENLVNIIQINKLSKNAIKLLISDKKEVDEWISQKTKQIMRNFVGKWDENAENIMYGTIREIVYFKRNILLRYEIVKGDKKETDIMKSIDVFNVAKDDVIEKVGIRIEDRRKGGLKTKKVKIKNKETKEVKEFESVAEAMEYLGVKNRMQWNRFVKGVNKSISNYVIEK